MSVQKVNRKVAQTHRLRLYKAGSIVFAKSGMSCMKGHVYTLRNDCYAVSHLAILTPRDIDSSYLNYVLRYFKPNTLVKNEAYPSIALGDIADFLIPVAPRSTQMQIVSLLDKISGVIESKKEQLKELDNLTQAIFYDIFGDPATNEKGWNQRNFEQCIEKVKYTKKIQTTDFLIQGVYPVVSQEERFISGYWNDSTDVFKVGNKPVVVFGDHTREIKYVDFDFVLGADGVRIFLPKDSINPRYLQWFLKTYRVPSLGYSRHYKLVKEIDVAIPPLNIQQVFAEKVEAIERQKDLINQSISEAQTLFDSQMEYYFGE